MIRWNEPLGNITGSPKRACVPRTRGERGKRMLKQSRATGMDKEMRTNRTTRNDEVQVDGGGGRRSAVVKVCIVGRGLAVEWMQWRGRHQKLSGP